MIGSWVVTEYENKSKVQWLTEVIYKGVPFWVHYELYKLIPKTRWKDNNCSPTHVLCQWVECWKNKIMRCDWIRSTAESNYQISFKQSSMRSHSTFLPGHFERIWFCISSWFEWPDIWKCNTSQWPMQKLSKNTKVSTSRLPFILLC